MIKRCVSSGELGVFQRCPTIFWPVGQRIARILSMGEAYWDVVPELAGTPAQDVALKTHYGVGGNEEVEVGGSLFQVGVKMRQMDMDGSGPTLCMAVHCIG